MPSIKEFDFFLEEPSAPEYMDSVNRNINNTGIMAVDPRDALEIAARHQIDPETSKIFCFEAKNRVKETLRQKAYFPYEVLPEGWIDELD